MLVSLSTASLKHGVQITSDGHKPYLQAIEGVFSSRSTDMGFDNPNPEIHVSLTSPDTSFQISADRSLAGGLEIINSRRRGPLYRTRSFRVLRFRTEVTPRSSDQACDTESLRLRAEIRSPPFLQDQPACGSPSISDRKREPTTPTA